MDEFQVAGGGDMPEQQMQQTIVHVEKPDPAFELEWWMSVVIVPLLVAMIPLWLVRRRRR